MLNPRIAAADYIGKQVSEGETWPAFDVGALRYYSQRHLIDLGGQVNPVLLERYQSERFDQYLIENNADCLVVPERLGIDILEKSGLSQSNLFKLQQVKVF
jgi:hypothetical protein